MIICFNCPSNVKRVLDDMISEGEYADYGEAIISAIQNLLVIHSEVGKKGVAFLGNEHDLSDTKLDFDASHSNKGVKIPANKESASAGSALNGKIEIPEIFTAYDPGGEPPEALPIPEVSSDEFKVYPVNHWIFGMYNRLLPAKANCRALARKLGEFGWKGIPIKDQIEDVAYNIAEQAAKLGDYLRKHDKFNNLKRDDGLSTAFPGTSRKDEKSRIRYANQFIARIDKSLNISGLLIDFRLIAKSNSSNPALHLTGPGFELAKQKNPVLDGTQEKATDKLSTEEEEFLINHICNYVPVEASAYYTLLKILSSGSKSPNEIDDMLKDSYEGNDPENTMMGRIATHRAGAISRMIDLGIINRNRNGTRLSYSMTDKAVTLLEILKGRIQAR